MTLSNPRLSFAFWELLSIGEATARDGVRGLQQFLVPQKAERPPSPVRSARQLAETTLLESILAQQQQTPHGEQASCYLGP